MFKAEKGDTVKVTYTGRLADGTIFDSSQGKPPLLFIIGQQEVIEGFDEAVLDMVAGERKQIVVPFHKGYGPTHEQLIEVVERNLLPDDLQLVEGGQLEVTREDDEVMLFMVSKLTDTEVTLDANHPLAGKDLTFDIEMLDVKKRPADAPPAP